MSIAIMNRAFKYIEKKNTVNIKFCHRKKKVKVTLTKEDNRLVMSGPCADENFNETKKERGVRGLKAIIGAIRIGKDSWWVKQEEAMDIVYTPKGLLPVSKRKVLRLLAAGNSQDSLNLKLCVYLQQEKEDEKI